MFIKNSDIDFLINIVEITGKEIKTFFKSNNNDVKIKKSLFYDSPVTNADALANSIICDSLIQKYPDIPIVSEEYTNNHDSSKRENFNLFWLVDPLDGTKEFIKGIPEFTINIALIKDNYPILGIVHNPIEFISYYAYLGTGSHLYNHFTKNKNKIKCSEFNIKKKGVKIICSRSHLDEMTNDFIKQFNNANIVQCGSSLKFIKISLGYVDIYPRFTPCMEWDTAASQIIVEEAGGLIIDLETKRRMKYNKKNLKNNNLICIGSLKK